MITLIHIVKERKKEEKREKEREGEENMRTIFSHKRPVKQIIIHH